MVQRSILLQNSNEDKKLDELSPRPSPHQIGDQIYKFDWNNKWLNGEEYHYILINSEKYISYFKFERFGMKIHPMSIYQDPISMTK